MKPSVSIAALCIITTLAGLAQTANAWTYSQLQKESAKMAMTRRDPIQMPTQTPMVPYKAPNSDYTQFIDLYSRMYRDRTMMISSYINEEAANNIISILLYLRKEDPTGPLDLYFNVPGADLRPALAVYDLICQTREKCQITTVNLALCSGMGAFLCAAGTKGKRSAMPNSRFLVSRTGMDKVFRGQASDIALEVKNLQKWNDRMEVELSQMTGQALEDIQEHLKRDFYLSADEAVTYGLIDKVLLPTFNKRAAAGGVVGLGSFEGGEEQRYQGDNAKTGSGGGWGSQQNVQQQQPPKRNNDDDEPKTQK